MQLSSTTKHQTTAVSITNNSLSLTIEPTLGGSFLRFAANIRGEWLELTRSQPQEIRSSSDTASFLMAPYPNRIRDGKFLFEGREYQLLFPEKHAIHGDVRNRPWRVDKTTSTSVDLSFRSRDFSDINFPFPFSMTQHFSVANDTLTARCSLKNEGNSPMPAGCGFHPYFNRALSGVNENVHLQFDVSGVYPFTGEIPLPDRMAIPLTPEQDFSCLRGLDLNLDACFCGWCGSAIMRWPMSGITLTMRASENMSHLVLFSPPSKPFFALEPQSQMIDGFNFLAKGERDTGVTVLQPGDELLVWFTLTASE